MGKGIEIRPNKIQLIILQPFEKHYADLPGAMVVFATPGMLHSGLSLKIFKKWAPDERNMIIMPGYCVAGTVGHKVINGAKRVEIEGKEVLFLDRIHID